MKKTILLLSLIICSCGSQNLTTTGTPSTPVNIPKESRQDLLAFKRSLNLPELQQQDIFTLCEAWAASYFMDPNQVITYRNRSAGILIGKYKSTNTLHYINTFKVSCSNGSATIEITNPVDKEGKNAINKDLNEARAALILQDWQTVTSSLFSYLNQKT